MIEITLEPKWLYFAGGACAAAVTVGAAMAWRCALRMRQAEETLRGERERHDEEVGSLEDMAEALRAELESAHILSASLQARLEESEQRRSEEAREFRRHGERIVALERELSEARTRLEEERRQSARSLRELKEVRESMHREFKSLAARIMEENARHFGEVSTQRVEQVLRPLRQQVEGFRKRVDEVHDRESRDLAELRAEIRNLKALNMQIGEEALRLTKALRGESKTRGIWGEMVLERVLEASGLREGEEYVREKSLRDEERRRFRPDVIVHLPDDRDIVIDAKTSLVAYEQYVNAEEEEQKARYAKEHLQAVREHIDRLSDKGYTRLEGLNTLDFIFMFMPIEGALMLALQEDPTLYDSAFGRGIVLVSPTTLLVALRAVENTWRHERQNRNAREIARRAGALYDKFVAFAVDLEKIGRQIDTVQRSYDAAWSKLSTGRGNLVRQVEMIRELGARTSKRLPDSLREESEEAPSPKEISE